VSIDSLHRALRPYAQPFDRIELQVVPRFKTSNLSGDEWRISVNVTCYRKGRIVHTIGPFRDMVTAAAFLPARLYEAMDDGKGHYVGLENFCDQEGCLNAATQAFQMRVRFGAAGVPEKIQLPVARAFCSRHTIRGDAGNEDCDENYKPMKLSDLPQPIDTDAAKR